MCVVVYGVVVVGQVVVVDIFGCFDYLEGFVGWYDWVLGNLQEVGDQGFDVLQCVFFWWWCGQWMVGFVRVFWYVFQVLFDDLQVLVYFVYFDYVVVVGVVVVGQWYFEFEVFVVGVGVGFVQVEVVIGGVQVGVGGVLFEGFFGVVLGDVDGLVVQDVVFQGCGFVFVEVFGYLVEEFVDQFVLVVWQVVGDVVDVVLGWVQVEVGDGFDYFVGVLVVGEGEEYWGYGVDVLDIGVQVQQVVQDMEEFCYYDLDYVDLLWYFDFGEFFY